jgi:AcrR family transcriptional regulator
MKATQKKSNPKKDARKERDLEKSRSEILNAAFWEVFSHGFQGVSIDDIVKKTSLTKGAFYHQFPTKLDLGYALVDEVIKPMIMQRWITPLNEFENPLNGVLQQMKKLIGEASASELKLGCPLNNLVQEMSPVDAGFRKRLQAALDLWISEMEAQLKRGQASGFIKKDVNVKKVAQFIVMAHEGFYGILKGLQDPEIFEALIEPLHVYFKTLQT